MNRKTILSTLLAAALVAASAVPALADDRKGKGKKNGHYSKDSGRRGNPFPGGKGRGHDDRRWDDHRRDDRWRWEENRRWEDQRRREEQWRREEAWRRSRSNPVYYSNRRTRSDLDRLSDQRQKTKNEWRNLALLSGGVSLLGLLQKDNRLVFAGAAGALYSLYRYEQDRKSQSKVDRLRASYFSRPYFVRDGRRYDRRLVTRSGQRYYQFVRR